jgi:transposase
MDTGLEVSERRPQVLLIGIDQSQKKHDVCLMNESGTQLARFEIPHDARGFERLDEERGRIRVSPQDCTVALESGHSLLVDYLLDRHFQVYVIPGKAVDRYRDRHRQSRSASDKSDAVVLAHILRTDCHLHTPWHADQPITRQVGSLVKLVHDLKRSVVRFSNRLRSLLWRYYPIAADLFSALDQQIALHFIQAYPTPQQASQLTATQFAAFCHAHRYFRSDLITRRYGQLLNAQTFADPEVAAAYASQAQSLARLTLGLVQERDQAQKQLTQVFIQHPDHHIFASLPGAGDFLAPALLAKFRDCRARFPTAAVAQAIAGTSPVTVQSGKKRRVQFRRACDKDFRYYATQFSRCSVREAPWAAAYFATLRPRCEKASQAYRCLANRWIAILWRLWTDRVPYDESVHMRNRHIGQQSR